MISAPEFDKKQILFVFFKEGEKISFSNDNLIVKDCEGKTKLQITCYRLFIVYAIGHFSVTSALIQNAQKFGFFIVFMTSNFRIYDVIGANKDGNTLLKKKQYTYNSLDIAKHITKNKISNQVVLLQSIRNKSDAQKEAIIKLKEYYSQIDNTTALNEIMGYEGLASKIYFKNYFNNIEWKGREPRIKRDYINSTLDTGYTLLFSFVDSLLLIFGFDTYCGVMHRQFYMRKSLVCDIVEPFRCIIDKQTKKSINLKQIKDADFVVINGQYKISYQKSAEYAKILFYPLIEHKNDIFLFVRDYYRSFMKDSEISKYPIFDISD